MGGGALHGAIRKPDEHFSSEHDRGA